MAAVPDAADGRIITASRNELKVWLNRAGDARDGACERTIQAHTDSISAVAMLPGAPPRVISVSFDGSVKLWALDGADEAELAFRPDGGAGLRRVLPERRFSSRFFPTVSLGGRARDRRRLRRPR